MKNIKIGNYYHINNQSYHNDYTNFGKIIDVQITDERQKLYLVSFINKTTGNFQKTSWVIPGDIGDNIRIEHVELCIKEIREKNPNNKFSNYIINDFKLHNREITDNSDMLLFLLSLNNYVEKILIPDICAEVIKQLKEGKIK